MYIIFIIFKGFYMFPWVHISICTLLSRESVLYTRTKNYKYVNTDVCLLEFIYLKNIYLRNDKNYVIYRDSVIFKNSEWCLKTCLVRLGDYNLGQRPERGMAPIFKKVTN